MLVPLLVLCIIFQGHFSNPCVRADLCPTYLLPGHSHPPHPQIHPICSEVKLWPLSTSVIHFSGRANNLCLFRSVRWIFVILYNLHAKVDVWKTAPAITLGEVILGLIDMFIFIRKSPFIQYCIVIDDTFSVVNLWFITSFLSCVCKIQEMSILDFMGAAVK
jgi:hypothetical protein